MLFCSIRQWFFFKSQKKIKQVGVFFFWKVEKSENIKSGGHWVELLSFLDSEVVICRFRFLYLRTCRARRVQLVWRTFYQLQILRVLIIIWDWVLSLPFRLQNIVLIYRLTISAIHLSRHNSFHLLVVLVLRALTTCSTNAIPSPTQLIAHTDYYLFQKLRPLSPHLTYLDGGALVK